MPTAWRVGIGKVEETNSLGVPRAKIQKQREPKSHEKLAKGLGTGVREFRKGAEGSYEEDEEEKRRRLEARAEDGRSEHADIRDERDS
jgi:hypothetical protein